MAQQSSTGPNTGQNTPVQPRTASIRSRPTSSRITAAELQVLLFLLIISLHHEYEYDTKAKKSQYKARIHVICAFIYTQCSRMLIAIARFIRDSSICIASITGTVSTTGKRMWPIWSDHDEFSLSGWTCYQVTSIFACENWQSLRERRGNETQGKSKILRGFLFF